MNNKQRKEQRKELLMQEASKIFEDIGFEPMKIAELSKITNVSIGTIYSIYKSKESLYLAYIECQIESFYMELTCKKSQNYTPEEKIYTFIKLKFSYYNEKRNAIEKNAKNNPLFFNVLYSENINLFQKIYDYLCLCFIELNPKLTKDKALRMAFSINGFSDGYISQWLELDDDLMSKVDEASELYITMIKSCK